MSCLPVPAIDHCPRRRQALLDAVRWRSGAVPNLMKLVGQPAALEGFLSALGGAALTSACAADRPDGG